MFQGVPPNHPLISIFSSIWAPVFWETALLPQVACAKSQLGAPTPRPEKILYGSSGDECGNEGDRGHSVGWWSPWFSMRGRGGRDRMCGWAFSSLKYIDVMQPGWRVRKELDVPLLSCCFVFPPWQHVARAECWPEPTWMTQTCCYLLFQHGAYPVLVQHYLHTLYISSWCGL